MPPPYQTDDVVRVTWVGGSFEAIVAFASKNGRSLILRFDAILDGFVGVAPVLQSAAGDWTTLTGASLVLRDVDTPSIDDGVF